MKKCLKIIFVIALIICSGCSQAKTASFTKEIFAMDTYMTITAYGDNCKTAVTRGIEEIKRIDTLLSPGKNDSEVNQINKQQRNMLSDDTLFLVKKSLELYQSTGGLFNLAIYPIMTAWGFTTKNYQVPSDDTLATLLNNIDVNKITYDSKQKTITLPAGMQIDFGGIAKGYTSHRVAQIFQEAGIKSGLINLGGNIQVVGKKPDGNSWRVALQNPDDSQRQIGVLATHDQAIITSGGYERYFKQDGIIYHHIIDPRTGYPANSGLKSVSIICLDGTLADGLSTSLFIMGKEAAIEYWQKHHQEFEMVLCDNDNNLIVSAGLKDNFSSENKIEYVEVKK